MSYLSELRIWIELALHTMGTAGFKLSRQLVSVAPSDYHEVFH